MTHDIANPFSVVKASDYSDEEINQFWVDMPGGDGFNSIVKPKSTMPMIILGGKGSGKTHLMRHFSYQLQKIRHASDVPNGIKSDGFLGIYLRCGALNTDRFSGKNIDNQIWAGIFSYYLEIWLAQILLNIVIDMEVDQLYTSSEETICDEILRCFDEPPTNVKSTIHSLSASLDNIRKNVDIEVNNCIYEGKLNVRILCSPGKLVFGIPEILEKNISCFNGIIFNYLFDELEHFDETKQQYLNTLIRDKRHPTSVKCGVRSYGMKTHSTLADKEENQEGHEFETIRLDDELRKKGISEYLEFCRDLCSSRLKRSGFVSSTITPKEMDLFFETPAVLDEIDINRSYKTGRQGKSISRVYDGLEKYSSQLQNHGMILQGQIDEICELLSVEDRPILEKASVYLFYQAWNKKKNLLVQAKEISERIQRYIGSKNNDEALRTLISHHKNDFVAQLRKDHKEKQLYAGFETLVTISRGFPRHLLTILKFAHQESVFKGEEPFTGGKMSIYSQIEGVRLASQWFFDESRVYGTDGMIIKDAVGRIAELFRLNRYSDKPTESSLISFYCDLSKIKERTRKLIQLATLWSLLIRDPESRKDKNTGAPLSKYVLNQMLSSHWGLPIGIRGVIKFDEKLLDAIFDLSENGEFEKLKTVFEKSRNIPFSINDKFDSNLTNFKQEKLL